MPAADHGRRSAGFTLLEVLVAFAILSFSLMAVFRAFQSGLEHERRSGLAAGRLLEARSIIDSRAIAGPAALAAGRLSTTGEEWRLETMLVAPPEGGWTVPAYRVTLTVGEGEQEHLRLTTVRLGG